VRKVFNSPISFYWDKATAAFGRENEAMSSALLGMLAYVLVQFAIGAYVSRRMTSDKDYILAGRSLGTGLVAFSVFATWFGAEAIVASSGEIYDKGLSGALTDPFGYGGAVLIVGLLLAARLWNGNLTTFADAFGRRYSPEVEKLFVIMLLPGSVLWAGAQIRAFGQIMSASSDLSLTTAIVLAAVLVAAYSVVGGLLADAITDVVQGLAVIIGLVVLTALIASHAGGLGAGLAKVEPERLAFFSGMAGIKSWEKLAIVICGSIVAVELASRFLGARSAAAARNGTLIGGLMYIGLGLLPIFLGLTGKTLLPNVQDAEQIVPKLAEAYLPAWGYALFAGALISAILSVVHAALHAPASQVSHNIIVSMTPGMSDRSKLVSVRMTVLALSVIAFVLALSVERIKDLVELASAFGSAGVFVTTIFALFTRIGGPQAATSAMLTGMTAWVVGRFVLQLPAPYLTAMAMSAAVYLGMAMLEGRATASAGSKTR
jgi:Na+/proline symporter